MRIAIAIFAFAAVAQETVAPTREPVGNPAGEIFNGYTLNQAWEFGYRFHSVGGNEAKYRSDVNFGNGIRLLSGRFSMNSKNGNGRLFDELTFSSQGLGNDPYQFSSLRIAKNRLYTYDMTWRESAYFNPAASISFGQHLIDTSRKMQDHDLILLPQSKIRFFVGFSRVFQDGPALSTARLFDSPPDEFPLLMNIRRRQNEYRFGNEIRLFGFRFNWMYLLDQYKEDSPLSITQPQTGNQGSDMVLSQFSQTDPWKGNTPIWRANLFREQSKFWGFNGRFIRSSGTRNFLVDQNAIGVDRFGSRNTQVLVGGDARRPSTTADLTASIFPTEQISVTNHTAYTDTSIKGNATYQEFDNSTSLLTSLNFQFLGMKTVANITDLNWRINSVIQVHGGYQFSQRVVRSTESTDIFGFKSVATGSQKNTLHAGVAGFRLQPMKRLTLAFDGEVGRQDRPFYPISDKNYESYSGRAIWKQKSLRLSATIRAFQNINSTSLTAFSARNRQYSFNGTWTPRSWLSLDAGYSKIHTNTSSGLYYFVASDPVTDDRSIYISNLHSVHLAAHFSMRRFDLSLGYSRSQDLGDGRPTLDTSSNAGQIPPFRIAQTFPMTFESPMVRFSIRLHEKIRWNIGYQYYGYREELLLTQNYRAHTGYTSVLWTF